MTVQNEKGAKLCCHAGYHSFIRKPRHVSQVAASSLGVVRESRCYRKPGVPSIHSLLVKLCEPSNE